MPSGPRIRANNVYGILNDTLLAASTTMTSVGLSVLPVVALAHAVIVIDPKRMFGEPEIVVVTEHLAGNTAATILRGQYGTAARTHAINTPWAHIAIASDYTEMVTSTTRPSNPYEGQLIYETDTNNLLAFNGITWIGLITSLPSGGLISVVTSSTRPATPYEGQVIYETDTDEVRAYDGDSWELISGSIVQQDEPPTGPVAGDLWIDTNEDAGSGGSGGGTDIYASDTAPSSPTDGTLWLDTDEGAETGLSSILAYAEVTANQTGIIAETDLTGLSVTITVPAGRRIRVTGHAHLANATVDAITVFRIYQDGTQVQSRTLAKALAGTDQSATIEWIGSPSAGTHTYKLRAWAVSGTVSVVAAANTPTFILVEDITGTLWPAGQSIGAGAIASEAWTNYAPTLVNMTLGNGTIIARYHKIGRLVTVKFSFVMGTTSAMGTSPRFSLPVPASPTSYPDYHILGLAQMTDVTTNLWMGFTQFHLASGMANLRVTLAGGTYVGFADITATVPFTWANTYSINTQFQYEAAS